MDITAIAGMVFSLLTVLVIGGLILLFPISRRLGKFLEVRIDERMEWDTLPRETLDELREVVEELQSEMTRIAERQRFVERLLEPGRSGSGAKTEDRS